MLMLIRYQSCEWGFGACDIWVMVGKRREDYFRPHGNIEALKCDGKQRFQEATKMP